MSENSLFPRQQKRLDSIQDNTVNNEGKTNINYFLSTETDPKLDFATELAFIYTEFCQKRNEYFSDLKNLNQRILKVTEELETSGALQGLDKKSRDKKISQTLRRDEEYRNLGLKNAISEGEYIPAKAKLKLLKSLVNEDYYKGKVAKKAEEIQQSEISQTAIQDLAKWLLVYQSREYPVSKEELTLAREKHQTFAEITDNLEKTKEILKPEVATLKQTLTDIEETMNNFVHTPRYLGNFGTLVYLANFLEQVKYKYNPFDGLAIAGFDLENENSENVETRNKLTLARNGQELLQVLSNKSLIADFLQLLNRGELFTKNEHSKQIQILKNPQRTNQELSELNQFLVELLELLPIGIQNGSQKKLNQTDQEKLDEFLSKPLSIDFELETDFIRTQNLKWENSNQIMESSFTRIKKILKVKKDFSSSPHGKNNENWTVNEIADYLTKELNEKQKKHQNWQSKVNILTIELSEISQIFVSFKSDKKGKLQICGNLNNFNRNKTQDEVYPVRENLDILVASCYQIYQQILPLKLGRFRNREVEKILDEDYVSKLARIHYRLSILEAYSPDKKYNSDFEDWLKGIKTDLTFLFDVLDKRKTMNFAKIWNSSQTSEIKKLQNHITISLKSIDSLLESISETNWSKTDIFKLAPINELLEKLDKIQTQKLQEILIQRQVWKTGELLLAIHNILQTKIK